jgi:hypothetical protein
MSSMLSFLPPFISQMKPLSSPSAHHNHDNKLHAAEFFDVSDVISAKRR